MSFESAYDLINLRAYHLGMRVKFDYQGGSQPIYIGYAYRGKPTSEAAWYIERFTYANNLVTDIESAPKNSVWDDRTGLTYT